MTEANINGWVLFRESLGKLFCTINRTVLSPSAPKGNLKMSEVTFKVFVERLRNKSKCMGKKLVNRLLLLKELNDRQVFPCVVFVLSIASRIWKCAAVKNESAAIAGRVGGKIIFIGK